MAGLFISGTASAAFIGMSTTDSVIVANTVTYRVYAHFDNPADQLLAISGNVSVQSLDFITSTVLVNNGGAFTGLKAEDFAQSPISAPEDSWVTIEADTFSPNDTDYSPGFLGGDGVTNVIKGSSFSQPDGGGWFDSNPGTPALDSGAGILIAQFTIEDEVGVGPGTWSLHATVDYLAGGTSAGLTSEPFWVGVAVPEPSAFALAAFGLLSLGLVGWRSRRRSCN